MKPVKTDLIQTLLSIQHIRIDLSYRRCGLTVPPSFSGIDVRSSHLKRGVRRLNPTAVARSPYSHKMNGLYINFRQEIQNSKNILSWKALTKYQWRQILRVRDLCPRAGPNELPMQEKHRCLIG